MHTVAEYLLGFGFGGALLMVGLVAFRAMLKRADTTPQWLDLAARTLDGFRAVVNNLNALNNSINEEAKERRKDSGQANELLASLGSAMTKTLDILNTMMGEMKTMSDEAEKRRQLDNIDTKTRYDALRSELESHNIRLSAIETAVQNMNERLVALETATERILNEISGIRQAVVLDVKGVVESLVKSAVEFALAERDKANASPLTPEVAANTPKGDSLPALLLPDEQSKE
jgi:hypothetical protein